MRDMDAHYPPLRGPLRRRTAHQEPYGTHNRAQHDLVLWEEGQAQQAARRQEVEVSVPHGTTAPLPSARDILEIQAVILRRRGLTYYQIGRELDVNTDAASALVADGARLCVDEEPVTALRVHLLRLEGLLHSYYEGALKPAPVKVPRYASPQDREILLRQEARERKMAREDAGLVLQVLAQYERIGTWLAQLPRRGQDVADDDDHAEIKAILLRAEEYGPPPGQRPDAPHGLPSMADWRPADVEEDAHDGY